MKYADRPSSTTTTTSDLPLFPLSSLVSIHPLPLFSSHFFPTPRVVTRVLSRWGRGEIAAEDRLLVSSLHLSSFFFFISPRFSILATPSNASILRSYSRSDFQLWDYACLFFFLFFEKNLQDCKKCILECIARSRRGSVVVPSPDRGTSRPSSALSRHKR